MSNRPNWISVSERLPTEDGWCLVWTKADPGWGIEASSHMLKWENECFNSPLHGPENMSIISHWAPPTSASVRAMACPRPT